jgi:hypothetical protein
VPLTSLLSAALSVAHIVLEHYESTPYLPERRVVCAPHIPMMPPLMLML